ncbi:NYN domain-containing protein [Pseudonocardia nantongensis]|uniref:NYN domain-containing protein n=1 Tax=Pseudonocardia nantongensis TaxID=1181885 RepID=UPI00397A927F
MARNDGTRPEQPGSGVPSRGAAETPGPGPAGLKGAGPGAAGLEKAGPDAAGLEEAGPDAAGPCPAGMDEDGPCPAGMDEDGPCPAGMDEDGPAAAERDAVGGGDVPDWPALSGPLRTRLAEIAGAAVGGMPARDVPAPLRRLARFTPAKRARLGAGPLVTRLEQDTAFRAAVVAWWAEHRPGELELPDRCAPRVDPASDAAGTAAAGNTATGSAATGPAGAGAPAPGAGDAAPADGRLPAPVDKLDAAAVALLTGDPQAAHRVAEAEQSGDLAALRSERDEALARAEKATAELERVRAERDEARDRILAAEADRDSEYYQMRRRVSDQGARLRTALDARAELEAEVQRLRAGVDDRLVAARAECESERERADRERQRADAAAREVAAARQTAREARRGDEVRLELLLDTIGGAVSGLRRELDIGAGGPHPADLLAGRSDDASEVRGRAGIPVDGLAALDTLLAMPSMHLVVDGYNVSKTGYPDLPLADQRSRLVTQLGALGARTGVEITVVFDGAAVTAAPMRGGRGVRVLFSDPGVLADDVIRDLVAAEPRGRPLLVATTDQEVVRSVRRRGAHSVPSAVLLRRLGG